MADELAQASAATKAAMDNWTYIQGQTNDQTKVMAAKQGFLNASARESQVRQNAPKPAAAPGAPAAPAQSPWQMFTGGVKK